VTTGDFENYIARDVLSYIDAHCRTIASRPERRDPGACHTLFQPDAVVRAGEAMTRFALTAAAMKVALAPAIVLDGEPGMHDPSTVIEADGKFYLCNR
jgi:hypothetical protein